MTTVKNWDTNEKVTVRVGDWVGFKSDVEQSGKIVAINKSYMGDALTLENENGFQGGYIGGQTRTVENASDCWVE